MNKLLAWRLCIAAIILLSILAFTPLVIPNDRYEPTLFSMPYTLWMGIFWTMLMVFVCWIGTRVHPVHDEKKGGES